MALIAHFKFNKNTENKLSGFSNTPTSLTYNTFGKIEDSAIFGSSSYITLASSLNLPSNTNWTISVWIKTTSTGDMSIFSNQSGGPVASDMRLTNGKVVYWHYNGTWIINTGTINVNDGRWHHVAWVNFSNNKMNTYVDGVLDLNQSDSTAGGNNPVDRIGRNWAGNNFVGEMDDFRIYNDADLGKITALNFNKKMIAHWPLTGNTNDYSGSGNNGTPANITYTTGKIGQAGSFNGTSSLITTGISQAALNQEFTLSAWIYPTAGNNYRGVMGDHLNNTGLIFCQYQDGNYYFGYGNGSQFIGIANFALSLNTWHHVTMILKAGAGGYGKVLLNGVQQGSTLSNPSFFVPHNNILIGRAFNLSDRYWSGRINDVRIYNYALSEYEAKELVKAKVAHYTFDNPVRPFTNQVYNSTYVVYNNFGVPASLTLLSETFQGSNIYRLTMTPTSGSLGNFQSALDSTGVYGFARTFLANTKYIFTILWRPVTHFDLRVGGTASNIGNWIEVPPKNKGTWTLAGQYRNGTAGSDQFDNIFTSFFTPSAAVGVPISIDFTCPTLIVGTDDVIDYVNYSNSSFNVVSDSSGLFNNTTLSESISPQWTTDSKIGVGSILFNGAASQHLNLTQISAMPFNTGMTFSVWAYPTASSSWARFIDFGNGAPSNNILFARESTSATITLHSYNGATPSTLSATNAIQNNVWQHFAFTISSSGAAKIYKNGAVIASGTLSVPNIVSRSNMYVGRSNWPDAYYNGYMDDIRVYTTELSDGDVLALYNRKANFDNIGNVQMNELIEDKNLAPNPGFEIDSTGTLTPSGWTAEVNTGTQLVNIDNRKALLFPGNGTYRRIRSTKYFPVTPGTVIYGKIFTRRAGGAQFYFGLLWSDGTYSYFTSGGGNNNVWTLDGGSVGVPAGVNSAAIWVFNFAGNTGALYVDDVYVSYEEIPNSYPDFMLRDYVDKYKINSNGQIIAMELDEVLNTQNIGAQQEIKNNGTLFINGEFSEVD
jgi:hypothetical protein